MIRSDVMMDEIKDCGGRVDKVRLPRSYWRILLSMLLFWGTSVSMVHVGLGPSSKISVCFISFLG